MYAILAIVETYCPEINSDKATCGRVAAMKTERVACVAANASGKRENQYNLQVSKYNSVSQIKADIINIIMLC
jgi:hypothetical protein